MYSIVLTFREKDKDLNSNHNSITFLTDGVFAGF